MAFNARDLAVDGVRELQPYQPGKPVEELERDLGLSDIVKLASNENPRTSSDVIAKALAQQQSDTSRYPDGSGYTLKIRLSELLGVSTDQLTLGNGSNDVLELLVRAFVCPGQGVVVSEHSFAVYSLAACAVGADLKTAPARSWGHDLDAMLSLVDQNTRVVFIANPNNPTGTWVESETLLSFLDLVPATTIVVIDEAYYEYCEDPDFPNAIDLLNKYPFLVSTRTFSKIYGLAGMRVGYSVSSPAIADLLNRVRQPFNVNSFGLAAARLALDDAEFLAESRRLNTQGRNRIYAGFSELGLEYIPSTGNFVCVNLARPAKLVHESMLKQGVIVRPVANYGLPNHLRVTVGLPHENEKMIDAMTVALAT